MSALAFPVLIGDIGGTNARYQLLESPGADPRVFKSVTVASHKTIEDGLTDVLSALPQPPASAILAAAGPIGPDGMDFTNSHWVIEPDAFLASTGIGSLLLVNDFEAQALALSVLGPNDVTAIGPSVAPTTGTRVAIGPGTGLGVGTLARAGNLWMPISGEGGHVDLGPRTDRDFEVWAHLPEAGSNRSQGTSRVRVSAEQVVSGQGLHNVYRAICHTDGEKPSLASPAEISAAGMAGSDPRAVEALELFCTALGRVAGDLALTLTARGGVFLTGGISGHILPFLKKSAFRAAFEDKAPHEDLLAPIGTFAITRDLPALAGLAAYANHPDDYLVDTSERVWGEAAA
ncbi:glucokinase [Rhizobiaceae bacterium]|nr:glucokinase [Rhizobiaceae bacterium]